MATNDIRPRRCMLLVPASSRKMIEKAAASEADMIMLDLDDAVVYEEASKRGARETLVQAAREVDFGGKEVAVRINSADTPWWQEDLRACAEAGIRIVMPPKVNTAADLTAIARFIDTIPAAGDMTMWPMIETTGAVLNCERMAEESPRLSGFCFGIGDYTVSVGAHFVDTTDRVAYPLGKIVCVARYHGLVPLAPAVAFTNMKSEAIIEDWGRYLRRLGYEGALVIHPKHVPPINAIFSPSREEVDAALEMRDAIAQARAENRAALIIGGKLVEKVNLDIAARTLAIAEKLGLVEPEAR